MSPNTGPAPKSTKIYTIDRWFRSVCGAEDSLRKSSITITIPLIRTICSVMDRISNKKSGRLQLSLQYLLHFISKKKNVVSFCCCFFFLSFLKSYWFYLICFITIISSNFWVNLNLITFYNISKITNKHHNFSFGAADFLIVKLLQLMVKCVFHTKNFVFRKLIQFNLVGKPRWGWFLSQTGWLKSCKRKKIAFHL